MIFFRVVDNDVINAAQIDLLLQIGDKSMAEFMINRVDQDRFCFTNEVAVVARPFGGFVFGAVKITHFPVTLTNPMNIVLYLNVHCRRPHHKVVFKMHLMWRIILKMPL